MSETRDEILDQARNIAFDFSPDVRQTQRIEGRDVTMLIDNTHDLGVEIPDGDGLCPVMFRVSTGETLNRQNAVYYHAARIISEGLS